MTNSKRTFSRRDFLKLAAFGPLAYTLAPLLQERKAAVAPTGNQKNLIVLVFDAWSAKDVSLYGYRRETVPNVDRFARNATVYHNHYSAGTFTVVSLVPTFTDPVCTLKAGASPPLAVTPLPEAESSGALAGRTWLMFT
jgi:hypothetical protein